MRMMWCVSDNKGEVVQLGVSHQATPAVLLSGVEHEETHFIWPVPVLSAVMAYSKSKLSFMVCTVENTDVLQGNSQKKSGGDLPDPGWPKLSENCGGEFKAKWMLTADTSALLAVLYSQCWV